MSSGICVMPTRRACHRPAAPPSTIARTIRATAPAVMLCAASTTVATRASAMPAMP